MIIVYLAVVVSLIYLPGLGCSSTVCKWKQDPPPSLGTTKCDDFSFTHTLPSLDPPHTHTHKPRLHELSIGGSKCPPKKWINSTAKSLKDGGERTRSSVSFITRSIDVFFCLRSSLVGRSCKIFSVVRVGMQIWYSFPARMMEHGNDQ